MLFRFVCECGDALMLTEERRDEAVRIARMMGWGFDDPENVMCPGCMENDTQLED